MMPNNLPPVTSPPPSFTPHHSSSKLIIGLIIVLALGSLGFAGLWAAEFATAKQATTTLKSAQAKSYANGQADQKQADDNAAKISAQSPYRAYDAPGFAGNFEIKFPKNWSASVQENESSTSQVILYANPNFVKTTSASGSSPDKPALAVQLIKTTSSQYAQQFSAKLKDGALKSKTVTVSGLSGIWYAGKFDDQLTGQLVIVGVRDKSLVLATHDDQYDNEFNQVVAQAHIIP